MTNLAAATPDPAPQESVHKNAKSELYEYLNTLATKEQICTALGMTNPDSKDEEFWDDAFRTVRHRFLMFCLVATHKDIALDWPDMTRHDAIALAETALECLERPNFSYTTIRNWFITRGRYEFSQAIELRREREYLAQSCIRVLLLLETGGAKYLAYDEFSGEPILVDGPVHAHRFPVLSISQTQKDKLLQMAEHFEHLKKVFPTREIKLLPGAIDKTKG